MTGDLFKEIFYDIRQYCYPKPLRILKSEPSAIGPDRIERLIADLQKTIGEDVAGVNPSDNTAGQDQAVDQKFLADLATQIWRIRAGLMQPGSESPYKDAARSFRYLERLIDMLKKHDIRIIDKTGDFYDPGMMMEVIASEPMKGIPRDIIKETLEPMVLKGNRVIQVAQVVVGTPLDTESEKAEKN